MAESGDHIQISVANQDGKKTSFRIRKNTNLDKVLTAFLTKQNMAAVGVALFYNGKKVLPGDTPEKIGCEDGAELQVQKLETGGAGPNR